MTPTTNDVEPTTSATDELRRMLDERGVEWLDDSYAQLWCTVWDGQDGKQWRMTENQSGMLTELKAWKVTPEQAIAATLGSCNCSNNCTNSERTETCKLNNFADVPFSVDYEIEGYDMDSSRDYATLAECSSCGAYVIVPPSYHHVLTCDGDEVYQPYLFCPHCGRRIVEVNA